MSGCGGSSDLARARVAVGFNTIVFHHRRSLRFRRGGLGYGVVRRCLPALLAFLLLCSSARIPAQQGLSEEEKRRVFLKAREEMTTIPYTPSPAAKPKPKSPTPPAPAPTSPKPKPPATTPPTPHRPTPATNPPVPTPPPLPPIPLRKPEETAPIVVSGAGVRQADDDKEDEPEKKEEGFWSRVFGGSKSYKYLSPSVRKAIDRAAVRKGRWRYIVVHNSGTRQGNAKAFEHYHRYVRKMPNGMAYHFVVGNGTSSGNGQIEIGNRWHQQLQGGHVHSDYYNNIALGICFVGDFNNDRPKSVQLDAAEELIDYLRRRVGKVGGQKAVVRPHKAINPPRWPTDCPGDNFDLKWFRHWPEK